MVDYVEKATLRIIDDATPHLKRITEALRSLSSAFQSFEGQQPFNGLNRQLDGLSTKVDRLHKKIKNREEELTTGRGPTNGGSFNNGIFKIDISPLKAWSIGFLAHMGSTFESALAHGVREGTTQQYIAQSRLDNLPLSQQDRGRIETGVRHIRDATGGIFNTTDIKEEFADIYGITHNINSTLTLLPEILQFARTSIATTGISKDEGLATSRNIIKSLDVMSRLITNDKGIFTGDKDKYLKAITDSYLISGKFITAGQITTIVRNLRSTGKTLGPEAFKYLLLQAEGEGTRIGNTMNRLVTGIAGNATKRAKQNLVRYGLGYRDKNDEYHPIDEDRLRTNPYSWIEKHFREGFAKFYGLDQSKDKNRIDALLGDRAKIGSFIHAITSSRIAADELTAIVTDMVQLHKRISLVNNLKSQDERSQRDDQNALLQLKGTLSAFEQVLGTASKAILDCLVKPLSFVKNIIYKADDYINGDGDGGDGKLGRSTLVFGGAAVAGIAGIGAVKSVLGGFFGLNIFKRGADTLLIAANRLLMAANKDLYGGTSFPEERAERRILSRKTGRRILSRKTVRRGLAFVAFDAGLDYLDNKFATPAPDDTAAQLNAKKDRHAAIDIARTALDGAATGALIGTVVPVIGTTIGAAAGTLAGVAYSGYEHLDELKDIWSGFTASFSSAIDKFESVVGVAGTANSAAGKNTEQNDRLADAIDMLVNTLSTYSPKLMSDQKREATGATGL